MHHSQRIPVRFFDDCGKLIEDAATERNVAEANVIDLVFRYWSPDLPIERRRGWTMASSSVDRTLDSVPFGLSPKSPDNLPKAIEIHLKGYQHV